MVAAPAVLRGRPCRASGPLQPADVGQGSRSVAHSQAESRCQVCLQLTLYSVVKVGQVAGLQPEGQGRWDQPIHAVPKRFELFSGSRNEGEQSQQCALLQSR